MEAAAAAGGRGRMIRAIGSLTEHFSFSKGAGGLLVVRCEEVPRGAHRARHRHTTDPRPHQPAVRCGDVLLRVAGELVPLHPGDDASHALERLVQA